jgi:hypothetical protein
MVYDGDYTRLMGGAAFAGGDLCAHVRERAGSKSKNSNLPRIQRREARPQTEGVCLIEIALVSDGQRTHDHGDVTSGRMESRARVCADATSRKDPSCRRAGRRAVNICA